MTAYAGRGVHGQAVEHIGGQIVTGVLAEDATIDVVALETELDVSRTVIREALRVLAAKGLVGARQKRGTFVRPRGEWNLLDRDVLRWQWAERTDPDFFENLQELRTIIEPAGARLAAQRRTAEDVAALEQALAEMTTTGADPVAAIRADLAFHRALLAASHNELLLRMESVIEAGLNVRDRLVHDALQVPDPVPTHRDVLEAVRNRRSHKAERAMRALLERAIADLRELTPRPPPGELPHLHEEHPPERPDEH